MVAAALVATVRLDIGPPFEPEPGDAWRGAAGDETHPEPPDDDWPEDLAGPEYWMLRNYLERGEEQ